MKKFLLIILAPVFTFIACNNNNSAAVNPAGATVAATAPKGELYFNFAADGKAYEIAADDVSSTFNNFNGHPAFKIYAGADGEKGVLLTIPKDMKGPSSTPNGSKDFNDNITQGSVSLIDYPEKGYTTNSFNTVYPEMSQIIPDAVVITSIEEDGKDAKIITGTFNAKTYGSHSKNNTDTKDIDHDVKGKFRIRHVFNSMSGERF